jgi:MauM/NapG family ferredoxin protein
VQALSLLAFTLLVLWTARDVPGPLGAEGLLRLDPLAGAAAMLSLRRWLPAFIPALILLALTLALGRFWCGWLCPLGTLVDWSAPRDGRARTIPRRWHGLKYGLLLLTLVGALFGSLTLLALDPLTIFVRTVTTWLAPGANWLVTQAQIGLYRVGPLEGLADALDGALRPLVLSYKQAHYQGLLPIAGLFLGILALNRLAPRAWCRILCPLGGLLSLAAKGSWLKRKVGDGCVSCGACARDCRMGTIDPARDYASDSGECILCLDCAVACPRGAITFGPNWRYDADWEYDPIRRQALGMLGLGVAGAALAQVLPERAQPHPYRLRPPGAQEEALLRACLRCGICLRACPTHGLQPSLHEAGIMGLWTPILAPRLGHCEYSCNACGAACPTGAIPPLALAEKQRAAIGKAYVAHDLCLAWTGRAPCIVCEEMCPLPEKAIVLETVAVHDAAQGARTLQAPVVLHERCIGCGLCENRCPVQGEAAIRVRVDPLT